MKAIKTAVIGSGFMGRAHVEALRRIPVHNPEKIFETRPDYILILPWNIKDEIIRSIESARDWGGQFLVPIPEVRLLD